jgi:hypothetical protein
MRSIHAASPFACLPLTIDPPSERIPYAVAVVKVVWARLESFFASLESSAFLARVTQEHDEQ